MTTLPNFCPVSTYRYASTISSNGEEPVDHGAEPPGRDAFAKVVHDLLGLDRQWEHHSPAARQPRHRRQDDVLGPRSEVGRQIQAALLQHRAAPSDRALPDRVEDDVVLVVLLGEVHDVAVDDAVCAQPAHQLDVSRPAYGGHPRAEVREQLNRGASDRARGAVDQHVLAGADASLPDDRQGVVRTLGAWGDLLEGQAGGDRRDQARLPGSTGARHARRTVGCSRTPGLRQRTVSLPGRRTRRLPRTRYRVWSRAAGRGRSARGRRTASQRGRRSRFGSRSSRAPRPAPRRDPPPGPARR